tara:strand:- start:203 stop:439 length:237 start_codon:yes stop_codon:yes gene_type:complete
MEFDEITEESRVYPGEYLLYTPRMEIVLCGAYMPSKKKIKALAYGKMIEDDLHHFQKIRLSSEERKERSSTRCKGCSK